MTGKAILEAMSFVDESYIEEAENGTIRPVLSFRKLLPLAACLCLTLWGLIYLCSNNNPAANKQAAQEEIASDTPTVLMDKAESSQYAQNDIALDEVMEPQISEVPSVILRIEEWDENGFTATVEENADAEVFAVGRPVQVTFLPNVCIEVREGDLVYVTRRMPTEEDFPKGTVVLVRYQFIDDKSDTIHAEAISLAGKE